MKRVVRHDLRVWGYPATSDNAGPIHFAWACSCGAHGHGLKDQLAAQTKAEQHAPPISDQAKGAR